MIIEVSNELVEFIAEIEEYERKQYPSADFIWSYLSNGKGAIGTASANYTYKEFDVAVYLGERNAYVRDLDKHDFDNQETHPLASDYEEN